MRRIIKDPNSPIINQKLRYPTHAKRIRAILEDEQQKFCAYTEERLPVTVADDVEHFNANLKETPADGYNNWFAASSRWNHIKKDEKWLTFQPIMYPTEATLESRLTYYNGFYLYHPDDTEAQNLIGFLDLDNYGLVIERRNYINMLKALHYTNTQLQAFLTNHPVGIRFRRAIEAEFGIRL